MDLATQILQLLAALAALAAAMVEVLSKARGDIRRAQHKRSRKR